jgi:hypothetical protein
MEPLFSAVICYRETRYTKILLGPLDELWEKSFAELVAYKKANGHCNVVSGSLGVWVKKQRGLYKRGKLSPERIAKLKSLGFCWDVLAAAWDKRIAELTEFKNASGHCNVRPNHPLRQRRIAVRHLHKKGKLSPERIDQLNVR